MVFDVFGRKKWGNCKSLNRFDWRHPFHEFGVNFAKCETTKWGDTEPQPAKIWEPWLNQLEN
jgi:hypothetical protein